MSQNAAMPMLFPLAPSILLHIGTRHPRGSMSWLLQLLQIQSAGTHHSGALPSFLGLPSQVWPSDRHPGNSDFFALLYSSHTH